MKGIVLIALLISLGLSVTVTDDSKCTLCTEFKSQADCENTYHGLGCEWKDSACAKKTTPPAETFKSYCESIEDPATKCAKTFGCAYVDGKCTHFTGCTAYVKTTLADCQTISYKCLTNGTTCDDVKECTEYKENCEASPALSSPFKCKLDNGACRALNCSEAETSLQTNPDCAAWKTGCITNGYGCVDSLSNCSQYTGNVDSCLKMLGSDGKCSFDTTTTDKCKLRICAEYKPSSYDLTTCQGYKGTCVSTGFSCADSLSSCTAYEGNQSSCLLFLGTEGLCAADANANKCRARKCEDLKSGVLTECQGYIGTCNTNGVTCVTTLQTCAQYTGKKADCLKIQGSDGRCKGTSDTDSNAACVLKTCADGTGKETTDDACGKVQLGCKTTGAGCIDRLASCTSYTDDGACLTRVGSEGKCKVGTAGKCAAKACVDNTTATTNAACNDFKTGCVTSGAGCIVQSSCKDTVKQITCDETYESSEKCGWSPICVSSTSCGALNTKSLCLNYKVDSKPCFWENNACRFALCSDYTSADSTVCNTYKPGCISNGTKCANPANCATEFTGTKSTCEGYPSPAHCTNDDTAAATAACKNKDCSDTTITAASDPDCEAYLPGCLYAGTNKCIVNTAPCTSYSGTVDVCNTFTGYVNSTTREKCSSSNGTTCTSRQCYHAAGMTNNDDCNNFLDGCLYNGNGSCVSPSAGCSSYRYVTNANECRAFKGNSGATLCYDGSSNQCKDKACTDETSADVDSDPECANFMNTCVYNGKSGTRCVPNTNDCTTFEGTSDQCNLLTRNEQQCTRTESCKTRVCSEKTDANSNSDCTAYHSTCRLTHGSTNCVAAKTACNLYTLVTSQTDQQTYCNTVTEDEGGLCSYDTTTTGNCVVRACKYWVSSLAPALSCVNYLGKDTCALANTDYCYTVGLCSSYSIPASVTTGQAAWCNNLKSTAGLKCTHTGSGSTCVAITTCEGVPSAVDQPDCQIQSGQNNCVYLNGKCVTIQTACTGYSLAGVSEASKSAICSSFKSQNSTVFKQCAYLATTSGTCVDIPCENITTPTSQASCDLGTSCKYYTSACYTRKACASYTIPSTITDADLKRLFCQNMLDAATTNYCSFDAALNSGAGGCAAPKLCTAIAGGSVDACKVYREQDGTVCTWASPDTTCKKSVDAATACSNVAVASSTSSYDCDIRTTSGCNMVSSACAQGGTDCTALNGSSEAACIALKLNDGTHCSWSSGTTCAAGVNNCAGWTGATYNSVLVCSALIDKNGKKCTWKSGTTCADITCEDAVGAKSQADCDIISSGCAFYRGYCIKDAANCNTYAAHGADAAGKLTYCNGRINSTSSGKCTYVAGDFCINKAACSTYNVSSLADATEKTTNCKNSATTDGNGCTYFIGNNCVEIQDACTGYAGLTAASGNATTHCVDFQTSAGLQCIGVVPTDDTCKSPANCEAITSPTNQASCDLYVTGCVFYSNQCITISTCRSYTPGSNAKSFCKGLKDSVGNYCTATADDDGNCTTRACNDADAAFFTTHAECKAYSNLCKSDGFGCITASTVCTAQNGILSIKTCDSLLDGDGNNCTVATASPSAAACKVKSCSDNITAKSQADCDSFMTGCKWINPGCTDKTTPCTSYRGTQTECGGFIGNSLVCWSDSPTRGACRVKTCSDKSTAADDAECQSFLDGCVFNGEKCVAKNSSCSLFKGTKDTCSTFDKNSSSPCWSVSATVGPCTNKLCTHLASTKDSDCESFLPDSNCITDGTTCIQGPKPCSYFRGNADTCPLFKSNQGICKKGLSGFCAKRECYEAPFTYTKDTQCSTWSPGCVTNGRGCQSSVSCSDFQNQATCGAVTGCQWASSCKAAVTSCSSLTTSGQSICVNNTKKKCAWFNGTCRDPTCVDLDSTLNTHDLCKAALTTQTCTTTGEGCIQQGVCASYTTKTICEAAETTETEKKCTWKNASCRVRKCEDFDGTSDDACDKFLSKCKTTGTTCVAAPYGCSVFDGNQKYCLTDSSGNPCLYVNGFCYNYDECKDVTSPSKNQCMSFSNNCVAGSTTCIALNQCSKYTDLTSCYSGINSTVCGWLPSQTCAEFKQCGEATGTTLNECVAWNKSCVSDGTTCVPIGDCGSYMKPQSCQDNYDTAGNACFWTGTACRLKQCTDVTATTDTECQQNVVKEGVCTTNGTSCVLRAACTTYSTEPACTVGSDGIPCIFALPLGATTGNKSCRAQDCTDILGTTNELCIGKINNKNCVSNGKTCVSQGTCASYKNKVSCSGGGSDNSKCIFTAAATTADPLAGTCQAFTSCASASGDSATCVLNKSCKYTDSTKKCETTDCKTFTPSGQCQPIPSFDGKTFTICTSSANGCTAGDPTALAQADCYSLVSKYTYTWNTSTSKCQSCKGSTTTTNNSTNGNTTTNTTTDSGYVLGVSMALAILGFLA